jgi:hypothetical protein
MSNKSARFWAERSRELPFNTKAYRKWGKEAQWIHGEGPFASLAYCPSSGMPSCLTIQFYDSLKECVEAQFNLICGGLCKDASCDSSNTSSWHQIWDLSERGYKRLDKATLNNKFINNNAAVEPQAVTL